MTSSDIQNSEWIVIDDTESEMEADAAPDPIDNSDRLDTQRIQKLSKLRRANYRSRSYALIITIAAIVGAAQSGWASVADFKAGLTTSGLLPALIAVGLIIVAWSSLKWVLRIERELKSRSIARLADGERSKG